MTTTKPTKTRIPRVRGIWVSCATALMSFAASLTTPMSYDEAYWLGVAKMVASGRSLYDGAIDNKSPSVYATVWMVDALPGPYFVARAVLVGIISILLWRCFDRLIATGTPARWFIGSGLVIATLLLAEFQLAIELLALILLVLALTIRPSGLAGFKVAALFLLASSFDPRAVLMIPGALAYLSQRISRKELRTATAIAILGLGFAISLLTFSDDLRYGLIEFGIESRPLTPGAFSGLRFAEHLVALAAFIGFVPIIDRARFSRVIGLLVGAGLTIVVASVLPIPHYWIYLVLPLALVVRFPAAMTRTSIVIAFVILGLVPGIISLRASIELHRSLIAEAAQVALVLTAETDPEDRYAVFGALPHLVTALPSQNALRSPTSFYLAGHSERAAQYRRDLDEVLLGVEAIIDTGGLRSDPELVYPHHRPVRDIFMTHLIAFPRSVEIGYITIWLRD